MVLKKAFQSYLVCAVLLGSATSSTHVGHGFGDESQLSGLVHRTAQLPSVAAVWRHGFGGWDGHTETGNQINSRHKC